MSNKTDKWIDDNFDKIVSSLQGIVRIPSVEAEAEGPGVPFGKNVKAAEDYMLKLAGEYSFDTFEKDGKYCCVDAGQGAGKEMLGIICHLPTNCIGRIVIAVGNITSRYRTRRIGTTYWVERTRIAAYATVK